MTESGSPSFTSSHIVVSPVAAGDPPFRVIQIDGVTVGVARDMVDVFRLAHAAEDLHAPETERCDGGGKYKWAP
jgi:hypothetical protein